jgi:gamma-glutamyltranspeptidase/glutathione hydrolase
MRSRRPRWWTSAPPTARAPTSAASTRHRHLERGNNDPLITGLRALGHTVNFGPQSSGISTIIRTNVGGKSVLTGGADPRREGIVLGDTFTP